MPNIIKISANRSVVVVPKQQIGTVSRLVPYTIGQLSKFTIGQLGSA